MKETLNGKKRRLTYKIITLISNLFKTTFITIFLFILSISLLVTYLIFTYIQLPNASEIKSFSLNNTILISFNEIPSSLSNYLLSTNDFLLFDDKQKLLNHFKNLFLSFLYKQEVNKSISQLLANIIINENVSNSNFNSNANLLINIHNYIKEIMLTFKIENKIKDKNKILEIYLNNASFNNKITGIFKASVLYFNKKPIDLNETESLTLIAILKTINNNEEITLNNLKLTFIKLLNTLTFKNIICIKDKEKYYNEFLKYSNQILNIKLSAINKTLLNL